MDLTDEQIADLDQRLREDAKQRLIVGALHRGNPWCMRAGKWLHLQMIKAGCFTPEEMEREVVSWCTRHVLRSWDQTYLFDQAIACLRRLTDAI